MKSAREIAQYFASQHPEIEDLGNLKMQKLLYYAQGFYVAWSNGQRLFKEELQAWEHGPVQADLYHDLKNFNKERVLLEAPQDLEDWEQSLIIFLEEIIRLFGDLRPLHLRNKTHQETPWLESYNKEGKNNIISISLLQDYFSTYINKLNIKEVESKMAINNELDKSQLDSIFERLDQTISLLDSKEDNVFGLSEEVNQLAKEAIEQEISEDRRKELRNELVKNLASYTD